MASGAKIYRDSIDDANGTIGGGGGGVVCSRYIALERKN